MHPSAHFWSALVIASLASSGCSSGGGGSGSRAGTADGAADSGAEVSADSGAGMPADSGADAAPQPGPTDPVKLRVTVTNISQAGALRTSAGVEVPVVFGPGVRFVHPEGVPPWFSLGQAASPGIEHLAEDGVVTTAADELYARTDGTAGVFGGDNGKISYNDTPLEPGQSAAFVIQARAGDRLEFGMMWAQSNDIFVATEPGGVALFDDAGPRLGRITDVALFDAGTEVNQEPGAGSDQAPRQAAPNTGTPENSVIRKLVDYRDIAGYTYPSLDDTLDVTVSAY